MGSDRHALRRLAGVACSVALLLSAAGTASARTPAAASLHAPARATGHVLDRGRIVAREAARHADGVTRGARPLVKLGSPGLANRLGPTSLRRTAAGARIAVAAPKAVTTFDGISDAGDGLGLEPPDPWIAVSSTHVVQSTNGLVRVSSRAGAPILSVPTWALFGLGPSELDSDPRILWDAPHARWIGVLLSYTLDGTDTVVSSYLNVAVSETSDTRPAPGRCSATSTRRTRPIPTSPVSPRYRTTRASPSSSDKVVLTANEWSADLNTFLGTSFLVFRWSDVLAGVDPTPVQWPFADPTLWTIRPAIVESSSPDVHLVATDNDSRQHPVEQDHGDGRGDPDVGGPDDGRSRRSPVRDRRSAPAGSPGNHQRGGRPPLHGRRLAQQHAGLRVHVPQRGRRLCPRHPDSTRRSRRRRLIGDELIGPGGGTDAYMGGIGFSGDGTLFAVYSVSSSADVPSTFVVANQGSWTGSVDVKDGAASYTGSGGRWGDFVGVAIDPGRHRCHLGGGRGPGRRWRLDDERVPHCLRPGQPGGDRTDAGAGDREHARELHGARPRGLDRQAMPGAASSARTSSSTSSASGSSRPARRPGSRSPGATTGSRAPARTTSATSTRRRPSTPTATPARRSRARTSPPSSTSRTRARSPTADPGTRHQAPPTAAPA